jgi:hypothetical protein
MEPTADWSAYPHGYSLLLNEKAQFPQDLSCWRMKVDGAHQLFVDDHVVARRASLTRRLHPVHKHEANPLVPDLFACYVHPEPEGGYRLYGSDWQGRLAGAPAPAGAGEQPLWMGRSEDGLAWTFDPQPVLARAGATAPWEPLQGQLHGLLHEPDDPDPEKCWKLIVRDRRRRRAPQNRDFDGPTVPIAIYTSADGGHWTWHADTTLLRKGPSAVRRAAPTDPFPEGIGDALQVRRDPTLDTYVAHTKHTVGPDPRFSLFLHGTDGGPPSGAYEARVAGWAESDDLIHWSPPRIYAYPDAVDARTPGMYGIYEADGFRYESLWLSCFSMTANAPDSSCPAMPRHASGFKRNWIRLAGSRDGRHWYYLADREPFIPNGPRDSWDAHYLRMAPRTTDSGPLIVGDEVRFYYHGQFGGVPGSPGLTLPKSTWGFGLGLGVVPRDRFVSLEAGDEAGELITRPLTFDGAGLLWMNVCCETGGRVQAAVLEEDGSPIPGLDFTDAAPLDGDHLRTAVAWAGGDSLAPLRERYVRLAFRLQRAGIFSFWIE